MPNIMCPLKHLKISGYFNVYTHFFAHFVILYFLIGSEC